MSNQAIQVIPIDLQKWVDESRANPVLFKQRQVTEVVLTAIGLSNNLSESLVLKGGALMALAFKSERVTGDVDFTAEADPQELADNIRDELNRFIPESLRKLNYVDLLCQVQSVKKKPRPQNFEKLEFPALDVSVGYAEKHSPQEKWFNKGQSTHTLSIEISFRDQVYQFQELHLFDAHVCVKAFSINEIFAEKTRALLQQKAEHRDRYRRQDVFDLWYLLENRGAEIDQEATLSILLAKCHGRGITPDVDSLTDREVYERAKKDWETIALEISDLPDFDECYMRVEKFYRSLNWSN